MKITSNGRIITITLAGKTKEVLIGRNDASTLASISVESTKWRPKKTSRPIKNKPIPAPERPFPVPVPGILGYVVVSSGGRVSMVSSKEGPAASVRDIQRVLARESALERTSQLTKRLGFRQFGRPRSIKIREQYLDLFVNNSQDNNVDQVPIESLPGVVAGPVVIRLRAKLNRTP